MFASATAQHTLAYTHFMLDLIRVHVPERKLNYGDANNEYTENAKHFVLNAATHRHIQFTQIHYYSISIINSLRT